MSKRGRPRCPSWFKLEKRTPEINYDIQPRRAATVWWIYNESAKGAGEDLIEKMMPQRFREWSHACQARSIGRLLKNQDVKGCRIGTTVLPKIVEPGLFDQAQQARRDRIPAGGGRKGKDIANLYVKLAKCEVCEQRMKFREEHLFCTNGKCPSFSLDKRWRTADFDDSFDEIVAEVDRGTLLKEQKLDDIEVIDVEMKFWRLKKRASQKEMETLNQRISELRQKIKEMDEEISKLKVARTDRKSGSKEVAPVTERGQTRGDNEQARLKNRIAALIKDVVRDVLIAPAGTHPRMDERIKQAKEKREFSPPELEDAFIRGIKELEVSPFFIVRFKNGTEMLAVPDKNEPTVVDWWRKEGGSSSSRQEPSMGLPLPISLPAARVVSTFSFDAAPQGVSFTFPDSVNDRETR